MRIVPAILFFVLLALPAGCDNTTLVEAGLFHTLEITLGRRYPSLEP